MALAADLLRDWDDDTDTDYPRAARHRRREARGRTGTQKNESHQGNARERVATRRGPTRAAREGREEFRCRHCRALIGPTVGGGRHRNHCPLCLHSRHVDDDRPGDRDSPCRAQMAPVARFARPNGEPVIVHRCLGCGLERHNRVAADDNILLLARLPLVPPRLGGAGAAGDADGRRDDEAREAS